MLLKTCAQLLINCIFISVMHVIYKWSLLYVIAVCKKEVKNEYGNWMLTLNIIQYLYILSLLSLTCADLVLWQSYYDFVQMVEIHLLDLAVGVALIDY